SDASSVTRDYTLELDTQGPPLLSIFGGKLTTYRRLAEEVIHSLQPLLSNAATDWTADVPLPGGDMPNGNFKQFLSQLRHDYPSLPAPQLLRWAHAYGSRVRQMLGGGKSVADLGAEVLPGLYECELHYLIDHEWAVTADDILWRRSKLGLHLGADAATRLTGWLGTQGFVDETSSTS
ncbi:MAG TPA: glycerol-3-phosphate dehydrogenase C-terminal domain-containing protein, partial [Rhodocyclaceae bacterium]|nr:glycerol-3-phosphate dehydrogenase C-terminal domain-containing protein [Rhodocyclaceae bacterium]